MIGNHSACHLLLIVNRIKALRILSDFASNAGSLDSDRGRDGWNGRDRLDAYQVSLTRNIRVRVTSIFRPCAEEVGDTLDGNTLDANRFRMGHLLEIGMSETGEEGTLWIEHWFCPW